MSSSPSLLSPIALAIFVSAALSGCASSESGPLYRQAVAPRAEVLEVEGQLVEVGGRQVAYIDAFPSPHAPVLGAPMRLQVATAPGRQIAAVVTHVEPRLDGWLEVEADLLQHDAQVTTATAFRGEILLPR